jgi:dimethylamine---corrinoid protein Co-methyltransferase
MKERENEMEEKKYFTRMGDGSIVHMTEAEIRKDMQAGMEDAVSRGKIDPLTEEDLEHLYEIITLPGCVVGVEPGMQIVTTSDSGSDKINTKCGIPSDRAINAMIHERVLGGDSVDIGYSDYNYKTVKGVAKREATMVKNALNKTTMPIFYGAMPNLGFYTQPDGPVENWAVLLPDGKIKEALAAQEEAVEHSVRDIVYVAEQMNAVGADAMNLDTCGAAGDADFLAALKATEIIRERFPDLYIEIGMAGEFVLGMHGKLKYNDVRLAGLYPHKQVKLAEQAGASIFGPVVNTNCNMTFAWNMARVCTFIKACTAVAEIPIHANVGMGVCGMPMCENIPTDIASRVDKALVEICKIDGL